MEWTPWPLGLIPAASRPALEPGPHALVEIGQLCFLCVIATIRHHLLGRLIGDAIRIPRKLDRLDKQGRAWAVGSPAARAPKEQGGDALIDRAGSQLWPERRYQPDVILLARGCCGCRPASIRGFCGCHRGPDQATTVLRAARAPRLPCLQGSELPPPFPCLTLGRDIVAREFERSAPPSPGCRCRWRFSLSRVEDWTYRWFFFSCLPEIQRLFVARFPAGAPAPHFPGGKKRSVPWPPGRAGMLPLMPWYDSFPLGKEPQLLTSARCGDSRKSTDGAGWGKGWIKRVPKRRSYRFVG